MMVCAAWACNLSGRPIASQKQNAAVIACHQSSWNAKKRETQLICYSASFLPQPSRLKPKWHSWPSSDYPLNFFCRSKVSTGRTPQRHYFWQNWIHWNVDKFFKLEPSGDVVKKHYLRLKFPLVFLRRIWTLKHFTWSVTKGLGRIFTHSETSLAVFFPSLLSISLRTTWIAWWILRVQFAGCEFALLAFSRHCLLVHTIPIVIFEFGSL